MNATPTAQHTHDDLATAYLDLLKRVLTRYGFADEERVPVTAHRGTWRRYVLDLVGWVLRRFGMELSMRVPFEATARAEGRDWPAHAETMIGLRRLDNIEHCVTSVLRDGVPGDLVETGVWRGGASIFMRAVLRAHGDSERRVWLCDSFDGLPPPDLKRWPQDAGDEHFRMDQWLAIPESQVRANFVRYDLLDEQVCFLPGFFHQTLPSAPIERIAVLRLDGDMYGSTMEALQALYPRVTPGGYVIVDDYGCLPSCREAVTDYRREHGIEEPIERVDHCGVFWRKPR
jgi:O-methyltransferase